MLRKLLTLVAAGMMASDGEAARYLHFSFHAMVNWDVNIDTMEHPGESPWTEGNGTFAALTGGGLEFNGALPWWAGIDGYSGFVNLAGIDLSAPSFNYRFARPGGWWRGDYNYYIHQYWFSRPIGGSIFNLHVSGSDDPITPGIVISGEPHVPELPDPASWMLTTIGFGLIGGAARYRRTKLASFA